MGVDILPIDGSVDWKLAIACEYAGTTGLG